MPDHDQKPVLDRRRFLELAAAGGALALAAPAVATGAKEDTSAPAAFELEEMSIASMRDGLASGRFTATSLTESYLRRIEEIDRSGPRVNSIIEINPDALEIAAISDRERREGKIRGALHGIPVVIKDNIDTGDRMKTSAGSPALHSVAARDAFIVKRLREAGAVLLAKTNLSEWANFRSTRSTSGWSTRGGQTRNPYALDRNPCGSSSGSGAAVAASLAAAAIGTETDGSVVCPSSANGLVGIKPTLGLVSRSGIVPIAHSQDTAGPMARTVADAVAILSAISGIDSLDAATLQARGRMEPDYSKFLDPSGLEGVRIGVVRKSFGFNPQVDAVMNEALEALKSGGAILVDPAELATAGEFGESEYEVLLYEFKADLAVYLATRVEGSPRTLAELIRFNEENRALVMPYFGQEIFELAEKKGPLTDKAYRDALRKNLRLSRDEGIDATLRKHRLDALVAPTGGPAWPTDLINGDHYGGGFSSAAAVAGYPHITVPAGHVFGLPVGISFFGTAWSEPALIRIAYAFEQSTRARRAPRFLPVADLTVTQAVARGVVTPATARVTTQPCGL
ncbi:MAG TPA: amidase [Thermoanaerobaculia bacterium]|nr:amidase [Thermoanaerobaculia bacterium]